MIIGDTVDVLYISALNVFPVERRARFHAVGTFETVLKSRWDKKNNKIIKIKIAAPDVWCLIMTLRFNFIAPPPLPSGGRTQWRF